MLRSIISIGECMIHARICRVFNDTDGEQDAWLDAAEIAEKDGYNTAFSGAAIKKPLYLEAYPMLASWWETGVSNGHLSKDAINCPDCNDPYTHTCHVHDN